MCTIAPPPAFAITRPTASDIRNGPVRLTPITACQRSCSKSRNAWSWSIPALLTSTSMRPSQRSAAASTAARTCSGSLTSAVCAHALPPLSSIDAETASTSDAVRAMSITSAPSAANRRATASPMPRPPPVTMTCRPCWDKRLPSTNGTSICDGGRGRQADPRLEMIYDQVVIERIEVRGVGPDVDRYSWASDLDQQYGTLTIVRMFDDQGFEGVGAAPSYSTGRFDLAILETLRHLAPRVLGADPLEREAVWYGLQDLALEVLLGAQSALDIALWDIVAQRAGVPLHQLLGGSRKRLPAYASTPLLADA